MRPRTEFTKAHDGYLIKYLATYCPSVQGRRGNKVYKDLVQNADNLWPWHRHHPWQSWRTRYVKNTEYFDKRIAHYQKKQEESLRRGEGPVQRSASSGDGAGRPPVSDSTQTQGGNAGEKRAAEGDGEHVDVPKPKRVKLEVGERSNSASGSPQAIAQQNKAIAQEGGPPPSGSRLSPSGPSEAMPPANGALRGTPPSTPPPPKASQQSPASGNHTIDNTEGVPVPPPTQPQSQSIDSNVPRHTEVDNQTTKVPLPIAAATHLQESTNVVHSKVPSALTLPPLPKRSDTLVLSSSSPHRPSSPSVQGPQLNAQSPNRQKRFRERPRAQSEVFASVPPSPQVVPTNENVPTPSRHTDSTSGSMRAPPRMVETFFGSVLVDQKGRVPRRPLRDSDEEISDGEFARDVKDEQEEKEKWPPARGHAVSKVEETGKVKADHHAFSQLAPRKPPPSSTRKSHHPFSQVNQVRPPAQISADAGKERLRDGGMDRRAVADQFLGRKPEGTTKESATEPNEERVKEGGVIVATNLPPGREAASSPLPPAQPKQTSRDSKFPAPRASTRSPFRLPEPPQLLPTSRAAHPALARVRRQTFDGHGRTGVRSIDLVAMSASASLSASASRRSSASASTTRSRRSLPVPLFGDRADRSLVWPDVRYRSLLYAAPHQHPHSPSLTNHDRSDINTSISTDLAPHLVDVPLVQLYGLDYALSRMSANHGLALSVVQAVYERVNSLPEADAILRGMREVAEDWGEAEISRLSSEAKAEVDLHDQETPQRVRRKSRRLSDGAQLRYVPASEDGERSEYSPPETSRAARWKRQSLGQSMDLLDVPGRPEEVDGESDEAEEHQIVDRELSYECHEEELEDNEAHHEFSQHVGRQQVPAEPDKDDTDDLWHRALLINQEAQQLEQKVGKQKYRKHIVSLFK